MNSKNTCKQLKYVAVSPTDKRFQNKIKYKYK